MVINCGKYVEGGEKLGEIFTSNLDLEYLSNGSGLGSEDKSWVILYVA